MHGNNGKPIIGWLELAMSWKWKSAKATVHPIEFGEHQQCYGVMVGQRWLCGSDGALTIFDSISAATQFLNLLDVNHFTKGGHRDRAESGQDAFQCFRLGAQGITVCNKCHVAGEARASLP